MCNADDDFVIIISIIHQLLDKQIDNNLVWRGGFWGGTVCMVQF